MFYSYIYGNVNFFNIIILFTLKKMTIISALRSMLEL